MSEKDEIRLLDEKIALALDFLAGRRGRDRNSATTSEIAHRLRAKPVDVDRIMAAAHTRNLVHIYPKGKEKYYVINHSI